eukprot:TRINITY_DN6605_c0_g1_i2.p1 TRINITY_DN6605_c0_g1~~TRINITY_DN6605_c0_g1_i2.p1  ORF type:complete len:250 (+),score=49.54 TRINITY_DN6605_c0_g1_i2:86-835(+)
MVSGQCPSVRYSPMVQMAFPILKCQLLVQQVMSERLEECVRNAKDLDELYQVMKRDFWVVTSCYSLRTGTFLEGTRLTLQKQEPEGYHFAIRTPGTPPRWQDYVLELDHLFEKLFKSIQEPTLDIEKVTDLILTLAFYWYNFMPLSRGTAACGYISMVAMFLAVGVRVNTMVPLNFLVDWEAILQPKPEEFISRMKPWLGPNLVMIDMSEFDALPRVDQTFDTIRSMIEILNCENAENVQTATTFLSHL